MRLALSFLIGGFLLLGACTPTASPTPTSQALLADATLPKVLVTVEITATPVNTATPDTVNVTISPTVSQMPSATPFITPTRYVGVFIGEPTSISPDGVISLPPTLNPVAVQPNAQGNIPLATPILSGGNCAIPVAATFAQAYSSNPALQTLGCPTEAEIITTLVTQRFERGRMFWRDTRQMVIISDGGTFWRVLDNWNESLPADDPSLAAPEGMSQPVRGFGLAWRENTAFRDAIGWALGPEIPISSTWQEFQNGTLFLGDNNRIYALPAGSNGQVVAQ